MILEMGGGKDSDDREKLEIFCIKIEPSVLAGLRRIAKKKKRSVGGQIKYFCETGIARENEKKEAPGVAVASPPSQKRRVP